MPNSKIVAVIVAFHPDIALLNRVIAAAMGMVSQVLVVKNDQEDWSKELPAAVHVFKPPRNIGLGAAYNLGVDFARKENATHLLLLDQDSVAQEGMVDWLLKPFGRLERIAASGPICGIREPASSESSPSLSERSRRFGAAKFCRSIS